MNKKNLKMRPVSGEYMEQYNALLRYVFQVTEHELSSIGWQEKEIIRAKYPTMEKADVLGWFDGDMLTGYAFCWEDNAQELLGADDVQMQGLLQTLGRGTLTVTEIGAETALGVCKWHEKADETAGYMNLMLN